MKHTIKHALSIDQAKQVTEKAFEAYEARFPKYAPTFEWVSENTASIGFTAKGMKLSGSLTVRRQAIELALDVPLVFKMFQKRAVEVINQEAKRWIGEMEAQNQASAGRTPTESSTPAERSTPMLSAAPAPGTTRTPPQRLTRTPRPRRLRLRWPWA